MNIEETKKAIEVMQAYVDGKKIEVSEKSQEEYFPAVLPSWDWWHLTYRIKQPRWKDITITEALDLLKSGPKRARFSDDQENWFGSEHYERELTGFNLYGFQRFLSVHTSYRYCQILEEG